MREFLVSAYLFHVKFWFTLFKVFSVKQKTVFVSSFGDNIHFVCEKVLNVTNDDVIILQVPESKYQFESNSRTKVIPFHMTKTPLSFIRGIYHLATSRFVFIDNYFGFLSSTSFKKDVTCVQLWHANGAIKRFGLEDPLIKFRTEKAFKRFRGVYSRFHRVVVGSDEMAYIFKQAFGVEDDVILKTGMPRTDIFFDYTKQDKIKEMLHDKYPMIQNRKVVLYAPTFRAQQLKRHSIRLNIKKLYEECKDDFVLMLRLHPAIMNRYKNNYPDFIIDVSDYPDANHLLFLTDILVTDYSSIPFEYALLEKPMIFYPYDLEEYKTTSGLWKEYDEMVPGPIAYNTDELIELIKGDHKDLSHIKKFSKRWNKYNDGKSTERLVDYLYDEKSSSV